SAQQGTHTATKAKEAAESVLDTASVAQKNATDAKAIATTAQTAANKAQDVAHSVEKKVDLIQPLAKQDWIDGTKTIDALISPANLMASIKANSLNDNGSNDSGYRKPVEILITESGDIP
ncbi:alanine-zipper protein, partial [Bartonella sp. AA85SXKL]|uniref:alanine-zipper protein n=4 Tax=Bartonella TaxID=773 RepID=UPI0035D05A10